MSYLSTNGSIVGVLLTADRWIVTKDSVASIHSFIQYNQRYVLGEIQSYFRLIFIFLFS